MLNHRYQYPIIPVTGQVLTSGHFGDLKTKAGSHSVGIYDTATWSIATGSGNGKTFFIGYSSEATKDNLDKWHFGRTDGKKTEEFRGKDLISFEYSVPKRSQKETWTVGYDGSWVSTANVGTDSLYKFECGKTYGLQVNLSGSPTWRRWAKNLVHTVFVTTPMCDSSDCTVGCPSLTVDNETVYKMFAEEINTHNELSLMGVKARYRTDDYTVTGATHYDYTLTVPDGGTPYEFSNVQNNASAQTVYKADRTVDGKTVYKIDCLLAATGAALPTYSSPSNLPLAACNGTCPAGYTLTAGYDNYTIARPLSGTESLQTSENRQAFAMSVASSYIPTASTAIDMTAVGIPSTTTDNITVTAHKFGTGQAVTYSNGGGTAPAGLTTGNVYYVIKVDANTLRLASSLANAMAGTQVNITAVGVGTAHSLTPYYNAITGLTASTITTPANTITIAAHGFNTGEVVTYANGGGTSITNLTTATNYYVTRLTSSTFKLSTTLANLVAGTYIATGSGTGVGAAHSFTSTNSLNATYLSDNGSMAFINIKVPLNALVTEALADVLVKGNATGATCTGSAGSAISWVQGTGYYRSTRTLVMSMARKDCSGLYNGTDWLAELNAFYAADIAAGKVSAVTITTDNNVGAATNSCTDRYTMTQYSNCLTDGCLAKDPSSFPEIPQGYNGANGISGVWEVASGLTWDTPGTLDANGFQEKQAGLEITAEVSERYLSDCSMDIKDFYETDPVRMEISWVVNQMTGLPNLGSIKMPKVKRQQAGLYSRQSGEWLLREYLKAGAYDFTAVTDDSARMREILDQNRRSQIDRKAYYKLYYISYRSNKGNNTNFDQKAEVWETLIAFKEDDAKAATFETQFGSVFSKFDITLQERK